MNSMNVAASKARRENEDRVAEEYYSSLSDLNCNSKPLINMLTMLAEENIEYAPIIVKVVADHITKVPPDIKLPILYLIDSIVKNVKNTYTQLFSQCIVNVFCDVFEKVNEKIRERMYALRQTWNEVFTPQKLYTLDVRVKQIDNNWPITAKPQQPSIHVNPNFLKTVTAAAAAQTRPTDMEEILHAKTRELLELKKRKLELELEATKKHLEEQEKQLSKATETVMTPAAVANPNTIASMPTAINVTDLASMPTISSDSTAVGGMRARIFNANAQFRGGNNKLIMMPESSGETRIFPISTSMPRQMEPQPSQGQKQKVYPVQPALLNTIRHRDPRLARQQQSVPSMQSDVGERKGTSNQNHLSNSSRQNDEDGKSKESSSTSSSARSSHKSSRSRSSKSDSGSSESKSSPPIRHSPSRSSGRSGKSYSSRDHNKSSKDRSDRKRSGDSSKSSTSPSLLSSSASSSVISSLDRRKTNTNSNPSSSKNYDKDAFEIVPLATAMGHKQSNQNNPTSPSITTTTSSSSSLSPSSPTAMSSSSISTTMSTKHKMTSGKRIQHQQSSRNNNPNTSGGNSRHKNTIVQSSDDVNPNKDIDLRKSMQANILNDQVVMELLSSPHEGEDVKKMDNNANVDARTQSAAIAFVDKTSDITAMDPRNNNNNNVDLNQVKSSDDVAWKERLLMNVDDCNVEQSKKRPSNSFEDTEPATKKCKATTTSKLDKLFGAEDVDLRTFPGQIIAQQHQQQPPPPPCIAEKEKRETKSKSLPMKINLRRKSSSSAISGSGGSNFDDVRAKLAKATKIGGGNSNSNKMKKSDKSNSREHILKLSDLQMMNDEALENNDEKIRTIVTQAQELLETNSISHEQYKNLVQTVMSINETNKLKEAKRRDSLNTLKSKHELDDDDDDSNDSEMERREAVLKKRIPKIAKTSHNQTDASSAVADVGPLRNSENAQHFEGNKLADNVINVEDSNSGGKVMVNKNTQNKEKSLKIKWNDRGNAAKKNHEITNSTIGGGNQGMHQKGSWLMGVNAAKSGVNRFANAASNQMPMNMNPNQRLAQQQQQHVLPWHMQQGGGVNVPPPAPPSAAAISMLCGGMMQPPPTVTQPALASVMAMGMNTMSKPCNSIDNPQADMVRSIKIDNMAKEIRIYDEVAIVFMELDQPREIGFKVGKRDIFIDNQEPITLHFNDTYRTFNIAGQPYRLRFGFPSRELYIDDNWYEIYFGGPPVLIPLNNSVHCLKAEGPPPQVNIGPLRRDLVVGKINMIVDGHIVVPLFLDSKVQTFHLSDKQHTIQFADNLLTVLLDGEPIQVEYGGLPKKYVLSGTKYFIRFGTLPQGVIAGKVNITNMIYVKIAPPPQPSLVDNNLGDKLLLPPPTAAPKTDNLDVHEFSTDLPNQTTATTSSSSALPSAATLKNLNIDDIFQKLVSFGILSTTNSTTSVTAAKSGTAENNETTTDNKSSQPAADAASATEPTEPSVREIITPIDLSKSESVKTRQASIVNRLFSGMQCSSCGLRFSLEHTIKYSQHLDWHFRQNRRERDTSRKAHSRKWYYDFNDWVQYEEIEDLEEKEKNFFETQQQDIDSNDDTSTANRLINNSPIQSCPAGPNDLDRVCDMCQEKFEQFYHEELEEWHLRSAICIEDKMYHPICYNDYKASLNVKKATVEKKEASDGDTVMVDIGADDNATDILIGLDDNQSNDETKNEVIPTDDVDDDDDVIVLPNEEPIITEIDDDDDGDADGNGKQSETTATNSNVLSSNGDVSETQKQQQQTNGMTDDAKEALNDTAESDVEIQEPHIPFTDLDTYVEKELPPPPEESSHDFFGDIKIKEEPKEDDEDEDDGFEDVGTVLILPVDEITLQEESTCQSVEPATGAVTDSPIIGSPAMNTRNSGGCDINEPIDNAKDSSQISIDGDLESEIEHNLSATGMMTPAIPLASLVNKIKINITKNTALNSSDAPTTSSSLSATIAGGNHTNSNKLDNNEAIVTDPTTTATSIGSTIPVLCSGGSGNSSTATTASAISNIPIIGGVGNGHTSVSNIGIGGIGVGIDSFGASNSTPLMGSVSTISVIGSYGSNIGNSSSSSCVPELPQHPMPLITATSSAITKHQQQQQQPTPIYELKPSLKEVTLKKTPAVSCGVETSGLCSIM